MTIHVLKVPIVDDVVGCGHTAAVRSHLRTVNWWWEKTAHELSSARDDKIKFFKHEGAFEKSK